MNWRKMLIVAALLLALTVPAKSAEQTQPREETKAERDARMDWWRQARFGLFIHWGVYSVPAGVWKGKPLPGAGEWIMRCGRIPVQNYAQLPAQFNPVKFNADEWVRLAKQAGMKYIVITAKHHDGFAMFPSKASPFNIHDATPFKRDPLKELAAACRKQGIKLGFYYSQAQDWHHPGGSAMMGGHWDKAQDGSMDEYLKKVSIPQVKEILSNYGPIAVLWWDTPEGMTKERADLLHSLLKLQPGIITNDRLGFYPGDTGTPEQTIPETGLPGRDWETCMTMNETWGYKSTDHNWKPTPALIRNLVDIASKGGNYLLNVGPTSEGVIPEPSVQRLTEIGKWMKVNGASIYGTAPSPFSGLSWGRCTQKPGKLYLHVFDWPKDGKLVVPLKNSIKRAYLLSDKKRSRLRLSTALGMWVIHLPPAAPDPVDTVVVAEIQGKPEITPTPAKK